MKCKSYGAVKFPMLYQTFKTADEIANVINRSRAYVCKALKTDFTDREKKMLETYTNKSLFTQKEDK